MATIVLAATILCGCATEIPQTSANVSAAGGQLTPKAVQRLVQQYIRDTFDDPDGITDLQINRPMLATYPALGKKAEWEVEFSCNARDNTGAYTGIQRHTIFVQNGVIDRSHTENYEVIRAQLENM